ncbi:hypothetical protein HGP14_08820 [Rhizobium sp. P32RR-XVIII]|uniref:hypothetical protein n=1 Tax=Rhizobium sp. P32RR-XVIII TaxID=2726738 RepID=UPI001456D3A6|nr:hypothetical protein [Rhizobium sp. P32RR-XVIII]NLS03465.1 hypothetical protein [Rhizobium sp. P32RR-XVIII]
MDYGQHRPDVYRQLAFVPSLGETRIFENCHLKKIHEKMILLFNKLTDSHQVVVYDFSVMHGSTLPQVA